MPIPILSVLTWMPMASVLVAILVPGHRKGFFKFLALVTILMQGSGLAWALAYLPTHAVTSGLWGPLCWVERWPWLHLSLGQLGTIPVHYFLGVDSLNRSLLALALGVLGIGLGASWSIQKQVKAYCILYLMLNTCIMGSLVALDFLLFYIFFELTLLPVYFLIGLWGSSQSPAAAMKFFLYTFLGTMLILLTGLGIGLSSYDPAATKPPCTKLTIPREDPLLLATNDGIVHTFDLIQLSDSAHWLPDSCFNPCKVAIPGASSIRLWGFIALVVGFLLKLGAVPLHSWLPDAHVQASAGISIVLAGILLKLGGYGLLRVAYSIFPDKALQASVWIGSLGLLGAIYAGFNALAMQDFKKMVAYSSIAHMGFFLLGIGSMTVAGLQGALYQLISHGLVSSLLFLMVEVIDSRTGDRTIGSYRGLAGTMPYYTVASMIAFSAAMGLPGFPSFIAELLILLGLFSSPVYQVGMGIVAGLALLLNATYCVWTVQRLFGGPFAVRLSNWTVLLRDLSWVEQIMIVLVVLAMALLGIFPSFFLADIHETGFSFLAKVHTGIRCP